MLLEDASIDLNRLQSQLLRDSNPARIADPSQPALITQSRHHLAKSVDFIQSAASDSIAKTNHEEFGPTRPSQARLAVSFGTTSNNGTEDGQPGDETRHPFAHLNHDSSSLACLPSTVPETLEQPIGDHESKTDTIPMDYEVPETASDIRNTQGSDDGTQEISDTGVQEYQKSIRETAFERHRELVEEQEELQRIQRQKQKEAEELGEELQELQDIQSREKPRVLDEDSEELPDTCPEEELDVLDLASSMVVPGPKDGSLSPSQSQAPLTQFPESQRFKTPATAGKKRDHASDVAEPPPTESKNPFGRNAQRSAPVIGLSQLFANTQAISSPLTPVPTSALPSDRPSPGLELGRRFHDTTSSPMQLLSEVKRAKSEPQSIYITMSQSQDRREAAAAARRAAEVGDAQESDDSDMEPDSMMRRHIATRMRERNALQALGAADRALSSPVQRRQEFGRPSMHQSSSRSLSSSPPRLNVPKDRNDLHQADEGPETELDVSPEFGDEGDNGAGVASQPPQLWTVRRALHPTFIPDTTKRLGKDLDAFSNTQPSPTARQTRGRKPMEAPDVDSSASVRIKNSQRSRPSTQDVSKKLTVKSSGESVDVVPASPEDQLVATQPSDPARLQDLVSEATAHNDVIIRDLNQDEVIHARVLAFNSSHEDPALLPESTVLRQHDMGQQYSHYSTAHTKQPPASQREAESSQPIQTGQRKRKRMDEISQDDAMPPPTQNSNFDFMALDQDAEVAQAVAPSPDEEPVPSRKRLRYTEPGSTPQQSPSYTRSSGIGTNAEKESPEHYTRNRDANFEVFDLPALTPEAPPPVVKSNTPVKRSIRKSTWDIGESPKSHFVSKPPQSHTQPDRDVPQHKEVQRARGKVSKKQRKTPLTMPHMHDTSSVLQSTEATSTIQSTRQPSAPAAQEYIDRVLAPQMVFAYYFGATRSYYPAQCLGTSADSQTYKIQWPGYDPEDMPKHKICSLDLRIGDEVKVDLEQFPRGACIVRAFCTRDATRQNNAITDIYGHTHVVVEPKDSKVKVPKRFKKDEGISIGNVYIGLATWNRMLKRTFAYQRATTTTTYVAPEVSTPPIRASTPATPSSRGRKSVKFEVTEDISAPYKDGIFSGMAFALSYSDDDSSRQHITSLIHENGGTILQGSFRDLVDEGLKLKLRFHSCGFTALLTDRHSRRQKYMEALAFGLPCLSGKWVEASIKNGQLADWQDYLLPAGESVELDGAVKSRQLQSRAYEQFQLHEVLATRRKFFEACTVVFVTGKGKIDETRASYLLFVQILGADNVVKVADLTAAKEKLLALGDEPGGEMPTIWLMVADREREAARNLAKSLRVPKSTNNDASSNRRRGTGDVQEPATAHSRIHVADKEFVIQSLIMGRLSSRETYE
ncbi:radiation sensitive protein rad9 [Lithohypha guttulata]|uniref:Radiation sensitive protein rad9 n=1 Tax=Lithohypha guttulata TaxID=1690604 RepID=A0AAN7T3K4_9EURO|nr:radiation sensitive protein rad9 [Lithohypha guttulata]